MRFQNHFIFVTLAIIVSQSYCLSEYSETETADVDEALIVKRGVFDCKPKNCWGNIGELRYAPCVFFRNSIMSFYNLDVRDKKCPNKKDRYVTKRYLICFCCRDSENSEKFLENE